MLKSNIPYTATTQTGQLEVSVTNQDSLYAYCVVLSGETKGEEITLRKELTIFKELKIKK